ncbi:hypothetical protein FB45DRAFT_1060747 [Roridomyces roridus]|uniref:DUF5648 domain-containing protein n=1 Tax=Roridomyces roridus TaxID=1738132 RepID=A0AAD7BLE3_9AGAR|nr:hypothetical protein FB45DRAFT_1060747 [Roridomyces roridus]
MKSPAILLSILIAACYQSAMAITPATSALKPRTCGAPADAVPFYRTYNSAKIDHWYTYDVNALNSFNPQGWAFQNALGFVFLTQEEGTAPLFHLFNSGVTDNFYTMNSSEVTAAQQNGYGISGNPSTVYIYPTQVCGSVPVYRLYSASGTDNFYTTSESERVEFIANQGYTDVEITGYVLPVGPCS